MMEAAAKTLTGTTTAPKVIRVIEKNAPSEQAIRAFSEKIAGLVNRGDEHAA